MAVSKETKELLREVVATPLEDIGDRICAALMIGICGELDAEEKAHLYEGCLSLALEKCTDYMRSLDDVLESV